MTQLSYYWGGTTVGDATLAPYDDDEFTDNYMRLFTGNRATEGVLLRANYLEVTSPAAATVRVASGVAVVDGKLFVNTSFVDNAIVAPGAGSNYYTVVLQKSWAAQTVRIALLGPDPGAPPAVTQNDGITWEISIATVRITNAGVITVTDTREFCHFAQKVDTDNIEDASITEAKLAFSIASTTLIFHDTIAVAGDTIDWMGISGAFSNLHIVVAGRATSYGGGLVEAGLRLNFNGDAVAGHYNNLNNMFGPNAVGDQSGFTSGTNTKLTIAGGLTPGNAAAGKFGFADIVIAAYTSTLMRKMVHFMTACEAVSSFNHLLGFGLWTGTAAINRIQITSDYNGGSGNYGFAVGSEFYLYGMA